MIFNQDEILVVMLEYKSVKIILKDGRVITGKAKGEWGAEAWISYTEN
jgi:hypothetical protein